MTDTTYNVDDSLKRRILHRLGLETGEVEIREEYWNLGFCDTCDWPEEGFSVYVNGELVWPSKDYLEDFGGYIYADDNGRIREGKLSVWGQFDRWLNNLPWTED